MSQAAQRTYIIFENPVLLVSRTVTNPSQIVESIANALRINATILMSILRAFDLGVPRQISIRAFGEGQHQTRQRYPSFFTRDIF